VGISNAKIIIQNKYAWSRPIETNLDIMLKNEKPNRAIATSINIKMRIFGRCFLIIKPPNKAPIARPKRKEARTIEADISVAPTIVTTTEIRTTSYNRLASPVENIIKNTINISLSK